MRVLSMVLAAILCHSWIVAAAETQAGPPGERKVAMKEIPTWEVSGERARQSFLQGGYAHVQDHKEWGATYPEFKSAAPLYGQAHFQGLAGEAGKSPSLLLAFDHSEGKADTYDLLYLDENGDRNLANDPPRRVRKDLPEALVQKYSSIREQIWFEPVKLTFDFGPAGQRVVEMMARLWIYENGSKRLSFVPTTVRSGTFEIDGTTYRASLGYQHMITGRLDQPGTGLILGPEGSEPSYWWGADVLRATHLLDGRYYRFSCTPTGDQLTVHPYEGKLGVLEVGAGGRDVKRLEMDGSLYSKETAVAIGNTVGKQWPEPVRRWEVPVGDYYPAIVHVRFDNIKLAVSNNYHTSAQGQPQGKRETVAGIAIREDKPYVLDFSNKPVVVFEKPNEGWNVGLGQEVEVEAVLVDPVLDIMIRDLDDMANVRKESYKDENGKEQIYERPTSLAPKVLVKRADGEIVGEGVMPFG